MKHQNFYPRRIGDRIAWLLNFADKLPAKSVLLGLTAAQVAAIVAECLWLAYVLQHWADSVTTFASGCSKTTTAAQTGIGSDPLVLHTHVAPAMPTGVVPQPPGSLTRIFAFIQQIKMSGKCDEPTATELGVVGTVMVAPDLTLLLPLIHVLLLSGQVVIKWSWQGFAAYLTSCEIWVDRGDGKGFGFLTIDTTPNYTDTQTLPAVAAKWTYKAIYRIDEAQAGLWSAPVSLTVCG